MTNSFVSKALRIAGIYPACALATVLFGACGQLITERSVASVRFIDSTHALILVNTHRTREHGMTAAEALSGSFTAYRVDYRTQRPVETAFEFGLPRVTSADGFRLGDSVFLFSGRKEAHVYDIRTQQLSSLTFSEQGVYPMYLLRWTSQDSVLVTQYSSLHPETPTYAVFSLSTGGVRLLDPSGFFGPSAGVPKLLIPLGRSLLGVFASDRGIDSVKVHHLDSATIDYAAIPPVPLDGYHSPILEVLMIGEEINITADVGLIHYRFPLESADSIEEGRWMVTAGYALKFNPSFTHYYEVGEDYSVIFHRADSNIAAVYDLLR